MRLIQIHNVGLERLNLPCRHGRYTEDIDKRTSENTQSASLCISYSFVNDRSASIYPLLPLRKTAREPSCVDSSLLGGILVYYHNT